MVEGLRQFRPYVLGLHCVIRTDHAALRWFWRAPNLVRQQARWLDFLGEFDFENIYRSRPNIGTLMRYPLGDVGPVHSVRAA